MSDEKAPDSFKQRISTTKISLRFGLILALVAAAMTFVGQVIVSATAYGRYEDRQVVDSADYAYKQTKLEIRVRQIEEARDAEMAVLQQMLSDMTETAGPAGETPTAALTGSPFVVEQVMGSVVEIICLDNVDKDTFYTGSGTIVDGSGLILTNHHLIVSSDDTLVRYCGIGFTTNIEQAPQIKFIAETTAIDANLDLAVLQIVEHIDGEALPASFKAIDFDDGYDAALALKLGDEVYIAGYPGIGAETFTFTQGVVSGRVGKNLIKTSALIDSGTSGGAAFDARGTYIGTPTAAARGDIGGSLGYLIGADTIDGFLKDFYAGKLNSTINFPE